jgi:ABC-type polysaccharide/polyol phosphate transport system ATPase subunit
MGENELTGRENIYLNGAILGMMQKEIKRKFDEIVAFAEIDKFLDMPVKRYSSPLRLRPTTQSVCRAAARGLPACRCIWNKI